MARQDPLDALKRDPKASELLGDQEALARLLQSEEAKTLAQLFEQVGGGGLEQAAASAAAGDGTALGELIQKVRADPRGAKAMEAMDRKTSR